MAMTYLSHNTLIIGAGAHVPYGYPTSMGLTEKIKELHSDTDVVDDFLQNVNYGIGANDEYKHKNRLCQIAHALEFFPALTSQTSREDYQRSVGESLNNFLYSFCASGFYSLDSYLSRIKQDSPDANHALKSKWGRLIIAYLISSYERRVPFGSEDFDWVQFILNNYIKDNVEAFFNNPPKIITLNYDRYFEKCIYLHLIEGHEFSPEEAKAKVDSLNIIHVYGKLGCYTDWNEEEDDNPYGYGDFQFYKNAMSNIHVIGEARDRQFDEKMAGQISNCLINSQKVYLLGYGFDELNNKKLFSSLDRGYKQTLKFFTTNVKIATSQIKKINKSLGFAPEYLAHRDEVDIMRLLTELVPLEKEF